MDTQKPVLLVTNATTENEIVLIKQAITHAQQQNLHIKMSLVHVIPNLPTCYFNIPSMVLLTERYYEEARKSLFSVGKALGIEKQNQWLITGRMKQEVLRLANKLKTQFILASSSTIPDLHSNNEKNATLIRSISNMSMLA